MTRPHILLLGSGIAGFTLARELRRDVAARRIDLTVVEPEPYLTYKPLLPEVAGGETQARDTVVPLRRPLKGFELVAGSLESVDTSAKVAVVTALDGTQRPVHYDHVVFALGAVSNVLPIPGLDSVVKIFDAVIKTALGSLDQVILGQILRQRADDPWITARDSVVLYAQNYRGILKNALALTFVVWGLTFVLFLLVLGPVAALVALVPKLAGFWTFALAAVVAVSLKAALIDPFAMTALLQVYAKQTTGQVPHPEWTHRLEQMSDKFRELVQKARATARPAATPSASASASMPD